MTMLVSLWSQSTRYWRIDSHLQTNLIVWVVFLWMRLVWLFSQYDAFQGSWRRKIVTKYKECRRKLKVAEVLAKKKKYGRKKKAISGNDDEETTTTRCKVPRLDISVIIIKISGSLHISKFDYFTERFELLRQHWRRDYRDCSSKSHERGTS